RDGGVSEAGGGTPEAGAPSGTAMPPPPPTGKAPACTVAGDVTLGAGTSGPPVIAFGGGRFAAVWPEGGRLRAMTVDDGGTPGAGVSLPTGPGAKGPAIAPVAGGGYLVLWHEPGTVQGIRLSADATPAGAAFTVATTTGGDPRPSI